MTVIPPKEKSSARGMWLALGFVLSLFLVPYFIGYSLPDDYEGAVSMEIARTPERVWKELLNHSAHPLSGGGVLAVVDLPETETGPAWEERMERALLVVKTQRADAPHSLELLALDSANGVESRWTHELVATETGTQVTVRMQVSITDPSFSTPYFRVFLKYLDFARQAPRDLLQSVAAGLGEHDPVINPVD